MRLRTPSLIQWAPARNHSTPGEIQTNYMHNRVYAVSADAHAIAYLDGHQSRAYVCRCFCCCGTSSACSTTATAPNTAVAEATGAHLFRLYDMAIKQIRSCRRVPNRTFVDDNDDDDDDARPSVPSQPNMQIFRVHFAAMGAQWANNI